MQSLKRRLCNLRCKIKDKDKRNSDTQNHIMALKDPVDVMEQKYAVPKEDYQMGEGEESGGIWGTFKI